MFPATRRGYLGADGTGELVRFGLDAVLQRLVSSVHENGVMEPTMRFDQIAEQYRADLVAQGFDPSGPVPARRPGVRTTSREAFETFAGTVGAPDVLTVLDLYTSAVGLRNADDFAVSCLPASRSAGRRAAVVNVGMVQTLVIHSNPGTGQLLGVTAYVEAGAPVADRLVEHPRVTVKLHDMDGGCAAVTSDDRATFARLLTHPLLREALADHVEAMRHRMKRFRNKSWHNPWLWAQIADAPTTDDIEAKLGPDDVTSPDIARLRMERTAQQEFRALLVRRYPVRCAVCGLDVECVLEAAHLVPHAAGGRASVGNGRLLCANHHRAFDSGLLRWTGERFEWTAAAPRRF